MENFFFVLMLCVAVEFSHGNQCITNATQLKEMDLNTLKECELINLGKHLIQKDSLAKFKEILLDFDAEMVNFECCLNNFTRRLNALTAISKPFIAHNVLLGNYTEKMVSCAVMKSEAILSSPGQNIQWLFGLKSKTVRDDIIQHVKCYSRKDADKSCCAEKYHDKVETQLAQDCIHKAMLCTIEGGKDCLKDWQRCFFRLRCKTKLFLKTNIAIRVWKCSKPDTKLEDIIQCVIQVHPLIVSQDHKVAYCYNLSFGRTAFDIAEYKTCLNIAKKTEKTDELYQILNLSSSLCVKTYAKKAST